MGGKSSRSAQRGFQGTTSKTLVGHKDTVLCCAFSPDGRLLATCSADQTVMVWEMRSFSTRGRLKGHSGDVMAVCFSPDSNLLLSAGRDATVILWDVKTGEAVYKARKHTKGIFHCAYSPDDNAQFATASEDMVVGLWTVQGSHMVKQDLVGHRDIVFQVCFSPDKVMLASCSNDKKIILWNRSSGKSVGKLKDPYSKVLTCQFSPDGTLIAAVVDGERVRIWNTIGGQVVNVLEGHHIEAITCCAFSPDGRHVATGSGDKTYAIWDVKDTEGLPVYHTKAHDNWIQTVAYSPSGKYLATGSSDHKVRLWV